MDPLTPEEIRNIEGAMTEMADATRDLLRKGRPATAVVNKVFGIGLAEKDLGRTDLAAMVAVAVWMLARTKGAGTDGS